MFCDIHSIFGKVHKNSLCFTRDPTQREEILREIKFKKQEGGGGNKDVVMQALADVWGSSQCKIDNSLDTRHPPFPKEEIKFKFYFS